MHINEKMAKLNATIKQLGTKLRKRNKTIKELKEELKWMEVSAGLTADNVKKVKKEGVVKIDLNPDFLSATKRLSKKLSTCKTNIILMAIFSVVMLILYASVR